ncbi:MAG: DNA alkylation repair protein [Pseudomonadota bacterium]
MTVAETSTTSTAPALKNIFDIARFQHIALETAAVYPLFEPARFLEIALPGLDELSLMQRLRRTTQSLHACLPADYSQAISVLRLLAPRINSSFVTLVLPDYVGLYGRDDVDISLDALKFFTTFGSSEFAIREFLRLDAAHTLAVMQQWSLDNNEHVRRLASEGSRPRLPWSFRLDALMADPELAAPILENLRADSSLYVRKSVANHLNDITKTHPDWVLSRLESWPLDNPHTAWIARHALRSLIKKGEQRALALIGAGQKAAVELQNLAITPKIRLGQRLAMSFSLVSRSKLAQRLVVDYSIHYVKKSGTSSAKVFKLKELTLAAGQTMEISRSQVIRDFTTRVHHPGHHAVDITVNGEKMASGGFDLLL